MICCYHTKAKGQMCKEIIPIFLCVALLLSFTLPEIGDYTIRELIYGVQDTTTVVRGTRIACEIIAVSNPGYVVYTIYDNTACSYSYIYEGSATHNPDSRHRRFCQIFIKIRDSGQDLKYFKSLEYCEIRSLFAKYRIYSVI